MIDLDWKHVRCACRRQLRRRGVSESEIPDRAQDAVAMVLILIRENPAMPVALAVWKAARESARGRTIHRQSGPYIDAHNPLDSALRANVDRGVRESFERRAALAQLDLDDPPRRPHGWRDITEPRYTAGQFGEPAITYDYAAALDCADDSCVSV